MAMFHNTGRRWLLAPVLGLLLGNTALASEGCVRPVPPKIREGGSVAREVMLEIQTAIDTYLDHMQEYVDCLSRESMDASAEADRVVDAWNEALDSFKRKP